MFLHTGSLRVRPLAVVFVVSIVSCYVFKHRILKLKTCSLKPAAALRFGVNKDFNSKNTFFCLKIKRTLFTGPHDHCNLLRV